MILWYRRWALTEIASADSQTLGSPESAHIPEQGNSSTSPGEQPRTGGPLRQQRSVLRCIQLGWTFDNDDFVGCRSGHCRCHGDWQGMMFERSALAIGWPFECRHDT